MATNNNTKKEKADRTNLKRLALTGVLIGLGVALSMVRIWQMPLGGEVTLLSMLPITLIAIEYGTNWGLSSAFLYAVIRMFLDLPMVFSWGLSPMALIGTMTLDYILAFTVLGLAGIFRNNGVGGICAGIGVALGSRFVLHVLSGTIIFGAWMPEGWSNPLLYSICYNGIFMLPEIILTMAGAVLLFKMPGFNKLVSGDWE